MEARSEMTKEQRQQISPSGGKAEQRGEIKGQWGVNGKDE